MSKFVKNIFTKLKGKTTPKTENFSSEGIKMNVKGQRVIESDSGPNIKLSTLDNEIYKNEKLPAMLNIGVRFRVWRALFGIGIYFFFCYKLIVYRLKSDDLELMEREVKEDENLKSKIKELNKI